VTLAATSQEREGRAQRAPRSGLVGQVTSTTRIQETRYPSMSVGGQLRELNRTRRIRRMRRVVIASADAARQSAERGGSRLWAVFVTLTYRQAEGFGAWSTRDVSEYINRVRTWLGRRAVALRYQWVLELQQSGRPHYHIIFWLPRGLKLPKPDSSGHWTKGQSNIKEATQPVGYLVKYVSKGDTELQFPKGARLFGTGAPEADVRHATHRAGLPMWLSEKTDPASRCTKVARVGWVERATGAIFPSPYKLSWGRDSWGLVVVTVTYLGD